jgi:hypothetical protein
MGTTRRRRGSQADVESFGMRVLEWMGNHPHPRKWDLFNVLERLSLFTQRYRSKTFSSARLSRLLGSLPLSPMTTQSPEGGEIVRRSCFNVKQKFSKLAI